MNVMKQKKYLSAAKKYIFSATAVISQPDGLLIDHFSMEWVFKLAKE
jgi:hypothetical protein